MINLTYIRDFLHDPDGDRWSDSTLLYLIDKAQKDLVRQTRCLKSTYNLVLLGGVSKYTLPSTVIKITQVSINNCVIPITYIPKDCDCWRTSTGTPRIVLTSNLNQGTIEFYPTPLATVSEEVLFDTYGVYVDLGTGIIVDALELDYLYGIASEITESSITANIEYIKLPNTISNITDTLEINDMYEIVLKYYVCGHLLREDKDTNSRSLGLEELKLYEEEVKRLKKDTTNTFSSADYSIEYRRGV